MKVFAGKRAVTLTKRNFVGAGGEGSVYVTGGKAYKIYADPRAVISEGKVKELAVLNGIPEVANPEELLLNTRGRSVGYCMAALPKTKPLCALFTKAFKQRNGLDQDTLVGLVQSMRGTMYKVHHAGVLVVDANELNFLSDEQFTKVFFIDVDSYRTPSYPPTAIMDSIRDRHMDEFTEGTDWFSWGIVTFQLLAGIHPYKGYYDGIDSIGDRMRANVSVLHRGVNVPAVCPKFSDAIPPNYLAWYKAVFEDGQRLPPPADLVASIVLAAPTLKLIQGTDIFEITLEHDEGQEVLSVCGATVLMRDSDGLPIPMVRNRKGSPLKTAANTNVHYATVAGLGYPLMVWQRKDGRVLAREVFGVNDIDTGMNAEGLLSCNGHVYMKVGEGLYQIEVRQMPRLVFSSTLRANLMERATTLYDGVAIQDILGLWHATVVPVGGVSYTVPLKDLEGYKVVDAKFDGGVLMVLAAKKGRKGQYDRFVYQLGTDKMEKTPPRVVRDVSYHELNFATSDKGVCVHIVEDGVLELFHRSAHMMQVKRIKDPVIRTDMHLFFSYGMRFRQGSKIYSMRMK